MKNKIIIILFALTIFIVAPSASFAQQWSAIYGFQCITFNLDTDCEIAENQLQVEIIGWDVPEMPGYDISFTFSNIGTQNFVISEIYFDDPTKLVTDPDPDSFLDYNSNIFISPPTDDVAFHEDASPGDLPGGNNLPNDLDPPLKKFIADFSVEPDNPEPQYGVGPGEEVTLKFHYTSISSTYFNMIEALEMASVSVGLHVKSFGSGGSESLILNFLPREGPTPVPEPATMLLLGTGLAGIAGTVRRRKKIYK